MRCGITKKYLAITYSNKNINQCLRLTGFNWWKPSFWINNTCNNNVLLIVSSFSRLAKNINVLACFFSENRFHIILWFLEQKIVSFWKGNNLQQKYYSNFTRCIFDYITIFMKKPTRFATSMKLLVYVFVCYLASWKNGSNSSRPACKDPVLRTKLRRSKIRQLYTISFRRIQSSQQSLRDRR